MGGALGVLHATGPDLEPPDPETVERMSVLAGEVGTRIGTVRAFAKTQLQASTDPLTGLPNRRNLEEQVSSLLAKNLSFAVVLADLDHFKQINDTHGHDAGDRALRLFARTLRSSLRPDDIPARYGGEEFAIVLPNCDAHVAVATVERIRESLALNLHDGRCPAFTSSFGVATSDQADAFDDIVALADEALFAAKDAGRNRVIVARARADVISGSHH
jgi:diguanylate cyclase (GGDEF)-like protein